MHYRMQNHDENIMDFEHPQKNYRRTHVVYIFVHPKKYNLCTPYIFSVILTICLKKTMGLLRIINQLAKGVIGSEQWGIAY